MDQKDLNEKYEKLSVFFKDLEYVARINPLSALISCRIYIEGLLNIILNEEDKEDEDSKLSEKITKLEKKGVLKGRILTDIQSIRYQGNDASHRLYGTQSDASSVLDKCKAIDKWFVENKDNFNKTDENVPKNSIFTGIVKSIAGSDVIIREKESGKEFNFNLSSQNYKKPLRISENDEIRFEVRNEKVINIRFIGVIERLSENDNGKFGFVIYNNQQLYFSYKFIDKSLHDNLRNGLKVSFLCGKNNMIGKNDEIFEMDIIELNNGNKYRGKIKNFGSKGFGFITESLTGEDIMFFIDDNQLDTKKIEIGDDFIFEISENHNKKETKFKALNMKWIGVIQNIDLHPKGNYGFIRTSKQDDTFFAFNYLDNSLKTKLAKGMTVSFVIKDANAKDKKDEAHEIEIINI